MLGFYCLLFHLSLLRCAEMELLVRSSPDSGWQYSADFEESLPSYTQYDQSHFGRNCANKLSWSEMSEFVMIQNVAPNI